MKGILFILAMQGPAFIAGMACKALFDDAKKARERARKRNFRTEPFDE